MNRRGFLGSIAAAVVAAKAGLTKKETKPRTRLSQFEGESVRVDIKLDGQAIARSIQVEASRILGIAGASGVAGSTIPIHLYGLSMHQPVSSLNPRMTVMCRAEGVIHPGDFVCLGTEGHVRRAGTT